jgi:hypothetical protein
MAQFAGVRSVAKLRDCREESGLEKVNPDFVRERNVPQEQIVAILCRLESSETAEGVSPELEDQPGDIVPLEAAVRVAGAQLGKGTEGAAGLCSLRRASRYL